MSPRRGPAGEAGYTVRAVETARAARASAAKIQTATRGSAVVRTEAGLLRGAAAVSVAVLHAVEAVLGQAGHAAVAGAVVGYGERLALLARAAGGVAAAT